MSVVAAYHIFVCAGRNVDCLQSTYFPAHTNIWYVAQHS